MEYVIGIVIFGLLCIILYRYDVYLNNLLNEQDVYEIEHDYELKPSIAYKTYSLFVIIGEIFESIIWILLFVPIIFGINRVLIPSAKKLYSNL